MAGAVVALALVAVSAGAASAAPRSSAAAVPSAPNILIGSAQGPWGWIVNEANTFLQTQGLSSATNTAYSRQLIGSYVLLRLDGIITSTHRTPQEQAAYDYLKTQVVQEQYWTAANALRANQYFDSSQLNCGGVNKPELPAWDLGCIFSRAFGAHPSVQQYDAEGFAETFSALNSGDASRFYADMLEGVSYWGGLTSSDIPDLPDSSDSAAADIEGLFQQNQSAAVSEIVNDVTQALISKIVFEELPDPQDWAIMGAMLGVIITDAVMNQYDSYNVDQQLVDQLNTLNPANNPNPDLSSLSTASGMLELGYVVASQLLPTAYPRSHLCSFNSGQLCDGYKFTSDPAYDGSVYPTSQPPDQTAGDPFFQVTGPAGHKSFSQSLESPGVVMPNWPLTDPDGNIVNGDATSARGMSLGYALNSGLTSSIHNGMVVTSRSQVGSSSVDNSWLYRHGLEYTDQSGNIWRAWYQDGSFLHVRIANSLGGAVQSGLESGNLAATGCNETPLYLVTGPGSSYSDLKTGNDCLYSALGSGTSFSGVKAGDEISFLGQTRTVDHVTNCYKSDGFTVKSCTTYGPTALVLKPGASDADVVKKAFDPASYFLSMFLSFDGFPISALDSHAYKVIHLDTCTGRTCASGAVSSDLSNCSLPVGNAATVNCFRSPTISYEGLAPVTTSDGGSTWATRKYSARLIQPPTANPDSYEADANDGTSTCCTASSLKVSAATGFLANDFGTDVAPDPANGDTPWNPGDEKVTIYQYPTHGTLVPTVTRSFNDNFQSGSFKYTPYAGFGWKSPAQDQFTYQVCHAHLPDFARACSRTTVTITVRNAPPTAAPFITANTASVGIGTELYVESYGYHDREGDTEGATTFAWYRNGVATGVTGPTYFVHAADAGSTITAVVTPVAVTGSSPGDPVASNAISIPSSLGTSFYVATPTSQKVVCTPRALIYPSKSSGTTTCTASVTVNSSVPTAAVKGSAAFRSMGPGTFGAQSCTLGAPQVSTSGATSVITASCSVTYSPGVAATQTVVANVHFSVGGGWGTSRAYPSTDVVVTGPPTTLKLSGLLDTKVYTPQSATVRVLDATGATVQGYTGTVHFTANDPQAVLPADYTFTATDAGVHTFTGGVTMKTESAAATVTVSAPGLSSSSQTFGVGPGATAALKVGLSPGIGVAGTPQLIVVDAVDAYGNRDHHYTGTVHFTSDDPQAVLPPDATFTPQNGGEITVPGLVLEEAGTPSVTATDVANPSLTASKQATISPGPVSQFEVDLPASATAGSAVDMTVKAEDQYGNVVNGPGNPYEGTVYFTSSDTHAGLPSDYTFTYADQGVHTFTNGVIFTAAGSQSVTATDNGNHSITGSSSSVSVAAAVKHEPSLNYELLTAGSDSWSGTCITGSTSNQMTFSASGPAEEDYYYSPGHTSPYPGTFTASGSVTLDTLDDYPHQDAVTAFNETFTITATDGSTITGTVTLDSPNGTYASCSSGYAWLDYQATIVAADGTTCSDSGNASLDFDITSSSYFYEPFYSNLDTLDCSARSTTSHPVSLSTVLANPVTAWLDPRRRLSAAPMFRMPRMR
ncbi:MAG TPA: hypothetical protein VGH79_05780 [Gaiellaceae bacterium]